MLEFARAGAAVAATSATLEKTRSLGAYLRTLSEDDLRRAAVYMSGRAFPPSQRRTLGLGWSSVSKVISSLSKRDEDELGAIFRRHSDLGDWAGEALGLTPRGGSDARGHPHRAWQREGETTRGAASPPRCRVGAVLHQDPQR